MLGVRTSRPHISQRGRPRFRGNLNCCEKKLLAYLLGTNFFYTFAADFLFGNRSHSSVGQSI